MTGGPQRCPARPTYRFLSLQPGLRRLRPAAVHSKLEVGELDFVSAVSGDGHYIPLGKFFRLRTLRGMGVIGSTVR